MILNLYVFNNHIVSKLKFSSLCILLLLMSCDDQYKKGYEDGYRKGYKKGYEEGHSDGYWEGTTAFLAENVPSTVGHLLLIFIVLIVAYFLWKTYKAVLKDKLLLISDHVKEKIARRKILAELEQMKESEVFKQKINTEREIAEYKLSLDHKFAETLNQQDLEIALSKAFEKAYARSEDLAESKVDIYINLLDEISMANIPAKHKTELYVDILSNAQSESNQNSIVGE